MKWLNECKDWSFDEWIERFFITIGTLFVVAITGGIALLLVAVIWGSFREFSDKEGVIPERVMATIVQKDYQSGFATTTMAGGVPITTFYPDAYRLRVQTNSAERWVDVEPDTYSNAKVGDLFPMSVRTGKNTGRLYLDP